MSTFNLIQRRGESLYDLLEEYFSTRFVEPEQFMYSAQKFAYLTMTKKPQSFLQVYRHQGLTIESNDVEEAIRFFQDQIPGPCYLLDEEEEIIEQHNLACDDLKRLGVS